MVRWKDIQPVEDARPIRKKEEIAKTICNGMGLVRNSLMKRRGAEPLGGGVGSAVIGSVVTMIG